MALLVWHFVPVDGDLKKALVLLSFAPIAAVAPAFTEKLGGDVELSATTNTISVIVSIVLMTTLQVLIP